MTKPQPDDNMRVLVDNLRTGIQCLLSFGMTNKTGPRFRSTLRGWREGAYLIFDIPSAQLSIQTLTRSTPCVVRLFHEGVAAGFRTNVIDWTVDEFPVFRADWPTNSEVVPVRKDERVYLGAPCVVRGESIENLTAELVDISAGGCCIQTSSAVTVATPVTLEFDLPDGSRIENLAAVVRSNVNESGAWQSGCRFSNLTPQQAEAIQYLVSLRMDQSGDARVRDKRILVLAPRDEQMAELRTIFEQQRFELVCVESVIEALFLLRLQVPLAFLAGVENPDLPGITLCSLIRKMKSTAPMSVFLWGGQQSPTTRDMQRADADGWIRSLGASETVFKQVVQGINSRAGRS
jgi:c-di-GMP-binding flagellar brake protein YcgR